MPVDADLARLVLAKNFLRPCLLRALGLAVLVGCPDRRTYEPTARRVG